MSTVRQTEGRLTDERYWDSVWAAKRANAGDKLASLNRSYPSLMFDRLLAARLGTDRSRRFLEVGCGSGRTLIYYARRFGYSVTGCDYSDESCAMTRRHLAAAGIPGQVIQADLFTLTGEYDVIFSGGLIEHFDDPKSVLAKFVSLLSPGGTLISTVPNLSGLSGRYHRIWKPETFTTHRVVTLGDLRRWYEELGLQRIEVGARGSIIPRRFPRDRFRRQYPRFYPLFWKGFLGPLTWITSRGCLWAYRHYGLKFESERFSPGLYAIGDRA
jgi:2-polyprenyl-6-hydroxyphenyl methylase/3-demethylubiquinone-9 3-methyltransferase